LNSASIENFELEPHCVGVLCNIDVISVPSRIHEAWREIGEDCS